MISSSWKLRGYCYLSPSTYELTGGCRKSTEALAALYGHQILMCVCLRGFYGDAYKGVLI